MYKNDKYAASTVIVILTIGLLGALVLDMKNVAMVLAALLVFFILQQFSAFERRIQQLEHQYQVVVPVANLDLPRWGIVFGVLTGIVAAYLHSIAVLIIAIGVMLLSLIRILTLINQRLTNLEHQQQTQPTTFSLGAAPVELNPSNQSEAPEWFQSQADSQADLQNSQPIATSLANQQQPDSIALNSPSRKQAWWQPALDWLMHGNPILRVAIAILMIGVVLLLRFASEHWQLSLTVKLLGIAVTGGALTAFGYSLRKNNALFAVALQGAGLAIIFLTLIFAHHYAVIASLSVASVGFALLLIITVALSLKQDAVYLAILALSMAYLAPLLIPQYRPDSVFLLSYYLVINLAVAVMNFIKPWKILNQIAFFATGFIAGSVIILYAKQSQYHVLDVLLWLHIVLFIWLSVRYSQLMQKEYQYLNTQKGISLPPLLDVGLIFSVPILGFSLHAILMHQSSIALTWGAVALGFIYTGLGWWIKQKQSALSVLAKSFFILAVAFIALIFPLWKGAHWTAIGWVIQGTALIVWGVSERYRLSRYIGVILVCLSSFALFYQVWSDSEFPLLSTTLYAIALLVSAYFLLKQDQTYSASTFSTLFGGLFLSLALYAASVSGIQFFDWHGYGLSPYLAFAAAVWLGFIICIHSRLKLQWLIPQLCISSILLVLCYAELIDIGLFSQVIWGSNLRQFSFLIASLGLSIAFGFMGATQKIETNLQAWWSSGFWLALAAMGAAIWPSAGVIALALFPVLYSIYLLQQKQMLLLNQISVWLLTWGWLIAVSLSHQVFIAYQLPLFNSVDALSLLVLFGVLWVVYRHDFQNDSKTLEWTCKVISILIGLLVLSSIVVRALHIYLATPLWSWAIWVDGTVQLSLTLLWVILAFVLMTFSSQRQIRQLWFVGAALLGIVVIKLVGLDLSQTGTLTRVISFIGAGGVMLVIAYLAPLPPVQSLHHSAESKD